jgi:hypothetical protein
VLLIGEAFIVFSSRRLPALLEQHHLRFIFEKNSNEYALADWSFPNYSKALE